MTRCNSHLKALAGGALEPYRAVLRPLRDLLRRSRLAIEQELSGEPAPASA